MVAGMHRALALSLVIASSGCAFGLPLTRMSEEHDANASKFTRCETSYYLIGMLIDAVVITSVVAFGEDFTATDGLIVAPFALDALVGTAVTGGCLRD
jgi:hypothetical protein